MTITETVENFSHFYETSIKTITSQHEFLLLSAITAIVICVLFAKSIWKLIKFVAACAILTVVIFISLQFYPQIKTSVKSAVEDINKLKDSP